MRSRLLSVGILVGSVATSVHAFQDDQSPVVSMPEVRATVTSLLLNPKFDEFTPLISHLWKSNGGAIIARDVNNPAAQSLATELVGRITYDVESETLAWPVYGFADPASERFTPSALATIFRPYLITNRFDETSIKLLEANFVTEFATRPPQYDPLVPPSGLTMPADELLRTTGYYGTRLFVYSPENCLKVAVKCYGLGLNDDAIVLLSHALGQAESAKCYYLRGTIEMLMGYALDAKVSALGSLGMTRSVALISSPYFYERINGPASIQFRELVVELSRN